METKQAQIKKIREAANAANSYFQSIGMVTTIVGHPFEPQGVAFVNSDLAALAASPSVQGNVDGMAYRAFVVEFAAGQAISESSRLEGSGEEPDETPEVKP